MNSRRVAVLSISLSVAVAGPASGVRAQQSAEPPTTVNQSEAPLEHARALADAIAQYSAANERDPGFGGIWIDHGSVVIAYVGAVDDVAPFNSPDPSVSAVERQSVRWAYSEMQDEINRLLEVRDEGVGLPRFSAYIDDRNNRVVLLPEMSQPLSASALEQLAPRPGMVLISEPVSSGTTDLRGGQALSSGCTAGFTIYNTSTHATATLTAGHCGNTSVTQAGVSVANATSEKYSGDADRQKHGHLSGTPSSYLNNLQRITAAWTPPIGSYMCKYGNTTGTRCGYVESLTYAPSFVPSSTASFILTDASIISVSGDSGGPAYQAVQGAVGVTSGCITTAANCGVYPGPGQWNKAILTRSLNALPSGWIIYYL